MSEENPAFNVGVVFSAMLLDPSGQPNVVIDDPEPHQLIWHLVNNIEGEGDLEITPFESGSVGPNQNHFAFHFKPGFFTDVPLLPCWDTAVEKDGFGGITCLYVASKIKITVTNSVPQLIPLLYTRAKKEDANSSQVHVLSVIAGENVKLGNTSIKGKSPGPSNLTLVHANTPALSVPPIAVDFVGRRTLLNDGKTENSFTFAITNMMPEKLPLTPKPKAEAVASPTTFTVWFDVDHDQSDRKPWALTRIQYLTAAAAVLSPTPKSPTNWEAEKHKETDPPLWKITVNTDGMYLEPQTPVLFTFTGIVTDLDSGFARMYLRFENLGLFPTGCIIADLEKSPISYGSNPGHGAYIYAGMPADATPPVVNHEAGLYVHKFGGGTAAMFKGGPVGIDIGTDSKPTLPETMLQILDEYQDWDNGTLMLGPGNKEAGVTLRFGCKPDHSWMQSHGNKPLAINPIGNNVGIGISTPGSRLSVVGGIALGKSYAQNNTAITNDNLAVEGKVGVGTTDPGSSLSVAGGVAIGKTYAQRGTTVVADNDLIVEGNVGIGTTASPDNRLHVNSPNSIRLSFEANGGQLLIGGENNTVQLVAAGSDDKPGKPTAPSFMWLGGYASPNPRLPKMVLNATDVDIQADTAQIYSRVGIGTLADAQASLSVAVDLKVGGNLTVGGSITMDNFPVPYATSPLLIIQGVIWNVNADNGSFSQVGTGFSVSVDSSQPGVWFINFNPPFSDMPAVVTTPQFFGGEGDDGYNSSFLTYTSKTNIRIRTSNIYHGQPSWNDFGFIAIGPR